MTLFRLVAKFPDPVTKLVIAQVMSLTKAFLRLTCYLLGFNLLLPVSTQGC